VFNCACDVGTFFIIVDYGNLRFVVSKWTGLAGELSFSFAVVKHFEEEF